MRDNVEILSSYRHAEDGALYKVTRDSDVLISGSYIKLIAMIRTPERTE